MFDDMPTPIVLYRDRLSTEPLAARKVTWRVVRELLLSHEESPCTAEDGPDKCKGKSCSYKSVSTKPGNPMAWSPVVIDGLRDDVNVREITLLVLDFDKLSPEAARDVLGRLKPYEHVIHTTHGHRDGVFFFRAVILLSRAVKAGEWHRFYAAAVAFLGVPADPACKNRSRLYYRPSCPKGAPFDAKVNRGNVLNVDAVLLRAPATFVSNYPEIVQEPIPDGLAWDLDSQEVADAVQTAARAFPPMGRRHDLCLALGGMLRKTGALEADARVILERICEAGGSEDPQARAATVAHTYALPEGAAMTAFTRASEILGEGVARTFGEAVSAAYNKAYLKRIVGEKAATQTPAPPPVTVSKAISLESLKKNIATATSKLKRSFVRNDQIDAVILRRILRGELLAKPGGQGDLETVREGEMQGVGRSAAVRIAMGVIARAVPLETPWEAIWELVRASISGLGPEWSKTAEKSYQRAMDSRRVWEAEQKRSVEAKKTLERTILAAPLAPIEQPALVAVVPERIMTPTPVTLFGPPIVPTQASARVDVDPAWRDRLKKGPSGAIASIVFNAQIILENDDAIRGTVRWNEHDKKIVINGGALAKQALLGPEIIASGLQDFLEGCWGVRISHQDAERRLMMIARQNAFDPLSDYLRGLAWDGEARVDLLFIDYFGAPNTEHYRRISRRWAIGAVARAFEPGCKFENVLIFEGLQGVRKTSAFEALGGDFYCATEVNIRDKDAKMLAASSWIVELSELDSVRKSESSLIKAFFSNRYDKFRPPFGRSLENTPRRCVFVGTTNEERYLEDSSGQYRRYWPVRCGVGGPINLTGLLRDRELIWAEVVKLYLDYKNCAACTASIDTVYGQAPRCELHRWWLNKDEESESSAVSVLREEDQPWMVWREKILSWWRGIPPGERPDSITAPEVALAAGDIAVDRVSRSVLTAVGVAMKRVGFVRSASSRSYSPSLELMNAPLKRGLFVLPGGRAKA